jgi:hypothetical protein
MTTVLDAEDVDVITEIIKVLETINDTLTLMLARIEKLEDS